MPLIAGIVLRFMGHGDYTYYPTLTGIGSGFPGWAIPGMLLVVLLAVCGRIGVPGGNYLVGGGASSNPNDPRTWRTLMLIGIAWSECI